LSVHAGNAKTARNNNSSRFGKFVKIFFDARGRMQGAEVISCTRECASADVCLRPAADDDDDVLAPSLSYPFSLTSCVGVGRPAGEITHLHTEPHGTQLPLLLPAVRRTR
jgi:hypothetical protein